MTTTKRQPTHTVALDAHLLALLLQAEQLAQANGLPFHAVCIAEALHYRANTNIER